MTIQGRLYIVTISPSGLKLALKGRRKGLELPWESLVSGEAALATALNASIGQFAAEDRPTDNTGSRSPTKTARKAAK